MNRMMGKHQRDKREAQVLPESHCCECGLIGEIGPTIVITANKKHVCDDCHKELWMRESGEWKKERILAAGDAGFKYLEEAGLLNTEPSNYTQDQWMGLFYAIVGGADQFAEDIPF